MQSCFNKFIISETDYKEATTRKKQKIRGSKYQKYFIISVRLARRFMKKIVSIYVLGAIKTFSKKNLTRKAYFVLEVARTRAKML